jgi:hypothetical protein
MTKETLINLNAKEISVILYALESLTESDVYYLEEHHTSPDWVKEKLETLSKTMV